MSGSRAKTGFPRLSQSGPKLRVVISGSLYLGWLLCAQNGELDDENVEPPMQPGSVSSAHPSKAWLSFFGSTRTWSLWQPGQASQWWMQERSERRSESGSGSFQATRRTMCSPGLSLARTSLLPPNCAGGLSGSVTRKISEPPDSPGGEPRPNSSRSGEDLAEERRRVAAEKAAEEKARREREAAILRAKRLDKIDGREAELWNEVQNLISTKQPKSYRFCGGVARGPPRPDGA